MDIEVDKEVEKGVDKEVDKVVDKEVDKEVDKVTRRWVKRKPGNYDLIFVHSDLSKLQNYRFFFI